ncbi:beta-phosphoglucomutase family hydrolase [Lentzea tibetensis]|uniref:Beta-phosphoglucomutase n=1 Tax=Lentzea tibetensis TaxID=2591470 RepID=A0A563EJC1_9PSEU|nr:beta-phosphoglucomutase family hydrolase [Lentzea tibetensis]TWP46928.1 beta-phosphoglucomutase family hydrolase [Lentzea tibetensis]
MLGLPDDTRAVLFDLDGVLTSTAVLHREAWKKTFEDYLGEPFTEDDYLRYVDGRPRYEGVRTYLESRGLQPAEDTVRQVGDRKNALIDQIISERGVQPYPGSVAYVEAVEAAGLPIGVVTSSANATRVLEAAGLTRFVKAQIDGLVITRENLRGKPAPDSFLAGARALGVEPAHAAVFEDAIAGAQAGHAGGFGYVVGVDRGAGEKALSEAGANIVVKDLAELL